MYNKLSIFKLYIFVFQKYIYSILSHHFIQSPKQVSQTLQVIVKVSQLGPTLGHPMDYTFYGILQAKTGVGSLSLLLGIFPTEESNRGLPHGRQIL